MSAVLDRAPDVIASSSAPSPAKDYVALLSIGSEALRRAKATPVGAGSPEDLVAEMRRLFAEDG